MIVQFILDLDSRGFPPRRDFIEEMANSLLVDRNVSPVVTVAQAVRTQGKRSGHNHYVSNYGGAYSCL
jgi:hypothetical protein